MGNPNLHDGVWINGKRTITGKWIYDWASDSFSIYLNSRDSITGEYRRMRIKGDSPEWGNWKLKEM